MKRDAYSWVYEVKGNESPLFFILGMCALEGEDIALRHADFLTKLAEKVGFKLLFKAAFDKANRISIASGRGVGLDASCAIFEKIRTQFGVPVVTDVHETAQVPTIASVVDVLQIPAMLCRQTDLVVAAAKTGKPVFIKKGQFLAPEGMAQLAKKAASVGNEHVWFGERGTSFGYNNLVVDFRSFPVMKTTGHPVIYDVTHSVQRPGALGSSSGGERHFVPALAASAVVQGIAGIFMEVHEQPEVAHSDGPNSIRLSDLPALVQYLVDLDKWAKERPLPKAV
ncbi:3-deoxy-8-phosphooctulonate synthase [bacterium]|nr:3-deoxy-8-phosphooctulonate synthase [bacterium]